MENNSQSQLISQLDNFDNLQIRNKKVKGNKQIINNKNYESFSDRSESIDEVALKIKKQCKNIKNKNRNAKRQFNNNHQKKIDLKGTKIVSSESSYEEDNKSSIINNGNSNKSSIDLIERDKCSSSDEKQILKKLQKINDIKEYNLNSIKSKISDIKDVIKNLHQTYEIVLKLNSILDEIIDNFEFESDLKYIKNLSIKNEIFEILNQIATKSNFSDLLQFETYQSILLTNKEFLIEIYKIIISNKDQKYKEILIYQNTFLNTFQSFVTSFKIDESTYSMILNKIIDIQLNENFNDSINITLKIFSNQFNTYSNDSKNKIMKDLTQNYSFNDYKKVKFNQNNNNISIYLQIPVQILSNSLNTKLNVNQKDKSKKFINNQMEKYENIIQFIQNQYLSILSELYKYSSNKEAIYDLILEQIVNDLIAQKQNHKSVIISLFFINLLEYLDKSSSIKYNTEKSKKILIKHIGSLLKVAYSSIYELKYNFSPLLLQTYELEFKDILCVKDDPKQISCYCNHMRDMKIILNDEMINCKSCNRQFHFSCAQILNNNEDKYLCDWCKIMENIYDRNVKFDMFVDKINRIEYSIDPKIESKQNERLIQCLSPIINNLIDQNDNENIQLILMILSSQNKEHTIVDLNDLKTLLIDSLNHNKLNKIKKSSINKQCITKLYSHFISIYLQTKCDQFLRGIFDNFISDMTSVRQQALKSIKEIAENDPTILQTDESFSSIKRLCQDSKISVREAAVVIIGNFLMDHPKLIKSQSRFLIDKLQDVGASVKKKSADICIQILQKNDDLDENIKVELIYKLSYQFNNENIHSIKYEKQIQDQLFKINDLSIENLSYTIKLIILCYDKVQEDYFIRNIVIQLNKINDKNKINSLIDLLINKINNLNKSDELQIILTLVQYLARKSFDYLKNNIVFFIDYIFIEKKNVYNVNYSSLSNEQFLDKSMVAICKIQLTIGYNIDCFQDNWYAIYEKQTKSLSKFCDYELLKQCIKLSILLQTKLPKKFDYVNQMFTKFISFLKAQSDHEKTPIIIIGVTKSIWILTNIFTQTIEANKIFNASLTIDEDKEQTNQNKIIDQFKIQQNQAHQNNIIALINIILKSMTILLKQNQSSMNLINDMINFTSAKFPNENSFKIELSIAVQEQIEYAEYNDSNLVDNFENYLLNTVQFKTKKKTTSCDSQNGIIVNWIKHISTFLVSSPQEVQQNCLNTIESAFEIRLFDPLVLIPALLSISGDKNDQIRERNYTILEKIAKRVNESYQQRFLEGLLSSFTYMINRKEKPSAYIIKDDNQHSIQAKYYNLLSKSKNKIIQNILNQMFNIPKQNENFQKSDHDQYNSLIIYLIEIILSLNFTKQNECEEIINQINHRKLIMFADAYKNSKLIKKQIHSNQKINQNQLLQIKSSILFKSLLENIIIMQNINENEDNLNNQEHNSQKETLIQEEKSDNESIHGNEDFSNNKRGSSKLNNGKRIHKNQSTQQAFQNFIPIDIKYIFKSNFSLEEFNILKKHIKDQQLDQSNLSKRNQSHNNQDEKNLSNISVINDEIAHVDIFTTTADQLSRTHSTFTQTQKPEDKMISNQNIELNGVKSNDFFKQAFDKLNNSKDNLKNKNKIKFEQKDNKIKNIKNKNANISSGTIVNNKIVKTENVLRKRNVNKNNQSKGKKNNNFTIW